MSALRNASSNHSSAFEREEDCDVEFTGFQLVFTLICVTASASLNPFESEAGGCCTAAGAVVEDVVHCRMPSKSGSTLRCAISFVDDVGGFVEPSPIRSNISVDGEAADATE